MAIEFAVGNDTRLLGTDKFRGIVVQDGKLSFCGDIRGWRLYVPCPIEASHQTIAEHGFVSCPVCHLGLQQ